MLILALLVNFLFSFCLNFQHSTVGTIFATCEDYARNHSDFGETKPLWHVTGTGSGLLGGIPRVVVQMSTLTLKGPL